MPFPPAFNSLRMPSTQRTPPFDPAEVLTTHRLDAHMDRDMGRPMLNNYTRYAKVGGGQHGEVYLCCRTDPKLPLDHPEHRIFVVSKQIIIPLTSTLLVLT